MKHLTKILLVVVAIAGLAIGMSVVTNSDNSTNNVNASIFADNNNMNSNCGSGKCGGDDAKEAVKEKKCGEGKCGAGKCNGDNADAKKSKFVDMDTNEDGKVSKTEFAEGHNSMFTKMDKNKDGFIDADEVKSMHKSKECKRDKDKCGGNDAKEAVKKMKCGEGKCG